MSTGYAIFFSFIAAYIIVLVANFWIDRLGGGLGCLGLVIMFLFTAAAILLFALFAPENIQLIALYIGIGIVVLTLIINLLSQ